MPEPAAACLVSVIVRTVGRPSLAKALDAVAAQRYRPLEIVLVDAADAKICMEAHSGVPVRVLARGGRLDRPRAANAGLDAARGERLLFLDEDDTIEPSHVEDLLQALGRTPGARVAYSQTRLLDGDRRIFGGPFDRLALFRSNYLAIHAVLFARSLVAEGCRFDETLATFEDWDFWLQCAARTAFAFTGRPTALYRAASGESGAGSGRNLDVAAVLAQRARLMGKWGAARLDLVRRRQYALERAERAASAGRAGEAAQWTARAEAIVAGSPELAATQ